jgi:hypothetical protein
MSIQLIQERLNAYNCASRQEEENALREITQELALAALARADFFKKAAFQGGTCLRIFHSLERFSEDLDFMLKTPDQSFSFTPYIKNMAGEFESYGYNLEVIDRSKAEDIVKKCFLKQDSLGQVLSLTHLKFKTNTAKIRIKLEVDTNPPENSGYENRFLDFPFPFSVTMQDMPSLFSGKSHALLCREYTKPRDWYDFIWYISHKIKMNWEFLSSALNQQGPWKGLKLKAERNWYTGEMAKRIERIDWNTSKQEMLRFLKPTAVAGLDVWSKEFFLDCLSKVL